MKLARDKQNIDMDDYTILGASSAPLPTQQLLDNSWH